MSAPVQGQVVRAGEAAVAVGALEGLDARVLPVMPGQLVRARKLPRTAIPRALVRFLTCWRATKQPNINTDRQHEILSNVFT